MCSQLLVGDSPASRGCGRAAWPPGCLRRGRKNARQLQEIRMFLWLNCFVASIECVPGLDLNSCAGPGVCSTDVLAAVGRGMNNDNFAGELINAQAPVLPGLAAALHACAAAGMVAGSPQRWSAGRFGGMFGGCDGWPLCVSLLPRAALAVRATSPAPRLPASCGTSDFSSRDLAQDRIWPSSFHMRYPWCAMGLRSGPVAWVVTDPLGVRLSTDGDAPGVESCCAASCWVLFPFCCRRRLGRRRCEPVRVVPGGHSWQ